MSHFRAYRERRFLSQLIQKFISVLKSIPVSGNCDSYVTLLSGNLLENLFVLLKQLVLRISAWGWRPCSGGTCREICACLHGFHIRINIQICIYFKNKTAESYFKPLSVQYVLSKNSISGTDTLNIVCLEPWSISYILRCLVK